MVSSFFGWCCCFSFSFWLGCLSFPLLGGAAFRLFFLRGIPFFHPLDGAVFPPLFCWVVLACCPFFLGFGLAFLLFPSRRAPNPRRNIDDPNSKRQAERSTRPQEARSTLKTKKEGPPRPQAGKLNPTFLFSVTVFLWGGAVFLFSFSILLWSGSGTNRERRPNPSPRRKGEPPTQEGMRTKSSMKSKSGV